KMPSSSSAPITYVLLLMGAAPGFGAPTTGGAGAILPGSASGVAGAGDGAVNLAAGGVWGAGFCSADSDGAWGLGLFSSPAYEATEIPRTSAEMRAVLIVLPSTKSLIGRNRREPPVPYSVQHSTAEAEWSKGIVLGG